MNDRRDVIAAGLAGLAASLVAASGSDAAPTVRNIAQKTRRPSTSTDGS